MAKPTITAKACKQCSKGAWIPQYKDIPKPLRNLNAKVVQALRPFDVDVGPFRKAANGYRIKSGMFRLRWAEEKVPDKIAALHKEKNRLKAEAAYKYLMDAGENCCYKYYVKQHHKFLRRHDDGGDEKERRLPLQYFENVGIENALWPHLYWTMDMTETAERWTDIRRVQSRGDDEGLSSDEEEGGELGRSSIKKSFMRKALGPICGYFQDFELLQFVYDLSLWSRIGGAKNAVKGVPLRLVLKGETFSPEFWRSKHAALVDMQRQCGFPALFKTFAPWEFSFPYHAWILHEMRECGQLRQEMAGPETLHTAHVYTEIQRGLISGMSKRTRGRNDRSWSNHLLASEDPENPKDTVSNYFFRLEFQTGERKLTTQDYHGSGRVHCHSLDYLKNVKDIGLHNKLAANVPDEADAALRGYMLGRPHGRAGADSGWPVHDGPSEFDEEQQIVKLKHSEEEKSSGHRAYFKETLEILKSHQDVLHGNGRGLLLKYVSTYTPKFSGDFAKDWLNDEASTFSVARRVLFDYSPAEPEMWLYLAAKNFPPCKYGGTLMPFRVPYAVAGIDSEDELVNLYQSCEWRRDTMTMLEFLRKSNRKGEIARWIRERFQEDTTGQELEDFANNCPMEGEKLVACEMLSVFNDRWFGQWLVLNVAFRDIQELLPPDVVDRVPMQFQHVASALMLADDYWEKDDQIAADLELEGMSTYMIENFLAQLHAQRHLVSMFLEGELDKTDDAGCQEAMVEAGFAKKSGLVYNSQQKLLAKDLHQKLDLALKARYAETEQEFEDACDAAASSKPLAALGPPGTGKTTVVEGVASDCLARGGRVLYALPTAQQASRVRLRMPEADVDTCSGAFFLYRDDIVNMDVLNAYDLIVVDEVSQLQDTDFERILQMWEGANRLPALVFAGDFWQLPSITGRNAKQSPKWSSVFVIELQQMWRCKDEVLARKLAYLRTSTPDKKQLREIKRGHMAWQNPDLEGKPTDDDIAWLLENFNNTTIVTCTRFAASLVNDICLRVLFQRPERRLLATLPGDWEANPDNFEAGKVIPCRRPEPLMTPIYCHMKIFITKNVNKECDYINGMEGNVVSYDRASRCLHVLTKSSRHLAIYPYTEWVQDAGKVTAYPIRPGYACNIHKLQGAELEHITLWLDTPRIPAAGYVALSRVSYDKDYLLGGMIKACHFVPAH